MATSSMYVKAKSVIANNLKTDIKNVKNYNIHVPNKQGNYRHLIFKNRFAQGLTDGYYFIICHDYEKLPNNKYDYNFTDDFEIGFVPADVFQTLWDIDKFKVYDKTNELMYDLDLSPYIIMAKISPKELPVEEQADTDVELNDPEIETKIFTYDMTNMFQNLDNLLGFSKLELACIFLRVPETGDEKLDDLIRKSYIYEAEGFSDINTDIIEEE